MDCLCLGTTGTKLYGLSVSRYHCPRWHQAIWRYQQERATTPDKERCLPTQFPWHLPRCYRQRIGEPAQGERMELCDLIGCVTWCLCRCLCVFNTCLCRCLYVFNTCLCRCLCVFNTCLCRHTCFFNTCSVWHDNTGPSPEPGPGVDVYVGTTCQVLICMLMCMLEHTCQVLMCVYEAPVRCWCVYLNHLSGVDVCMNHLSGVDVCVWSTCQVLMCLSEPPVRCWCVCWNYLSGAGVARQHGALPCLVPDADPGAGSAEWTELHLPGQHLAVAGDGGRHATEGAVCCRWALVSLWHPCGGWGVGGSGRGIRLAIMYYLFLEHSTWSVKDPPSLLGAHLYNCEAKGSFDWLIWW